MLFFQPSPTQTGLVMKMDQWPSELLDTKSCRSSWMIRRQEGFLLLHEVTQKPTKRTPSLTHRRFCILIRSNVWFFGRQRGRLSVLLFLLPSFISFLFEMLQVSQSCPWMEPGILCMQEMKSRRTSTSGWWRILFSPPLTEVYGLNTPIWVIIASTSERQR